MNMPKRLLRRIVPLGVTLFMSVGAVVSQAKADIFNVKDYGATGKKADNARTAIQKAIDACAKAGGGIVYLPPGDYTSGTIHLRSHVRLWIEAGATLFSAEEDAAFDTDGLLFGEDLINISIEGRGTINGQSEYDWRMNIIDDGYIRDNQKSAEAAGVPLMRSFPKGMGQRKIYPHMIKLLRCTDVLIEGVSIIDSPSWTIYPYACERLRIDGIYIRTDQKLGVWADGISVAVRNVTINNVVITHSNRGLAFMVYDGGVVENVVISNVVINTDRFDWFWWGNGDPIYFTVQRRSESLGLPVKPDEPPAGAIRNVIVRNVIAHGKGACLINGHPDSWLDHVSLENIKLYLSTDPSAVYDRSVNAMQFHYGKNLTLRDVEVIWDKPELNKWGSALYFEDVQGLKVIGFSGRPAKPNADTPAIVLNKVEGATISNSTAQQGTRVFLGVTGTNTRDILLEGNELHNAQLPYQLFGGTKEGIVKAINNF